MTRLRPAIGAVALLGLSACAPSALELGQRYLDRGKPELAVQYLAYAHWDDREDEEVSRALEQGLARAMKEAASAIDAAGKKGDDLAALRAAIRMDELSRWAHAHKLTTRPDDAAARQIEALYPRAARRAVADIDDADTDLPDHERLELLRRAQALDPDNAEFEERYLSLRRRLLRRVVADARCEGIRRPRCTAALQAVLARMTHVRQELFTVTAAGSQIADTRLQIGVETQAESCVWEQESEGESKATVVKRNRFNEPIKDKKGKKVKEPVVAKWRVMRCTTHATATATATLTDLREGGAGRLFNNHAMANKSDTRRYVIWQGDQRALPKNVASRGTDRRPPKAPAELADDVTTSATTKSAAAIVGKLGQ